MGRQNWQLIFAIFLIAFGGLFLLSNLGMLPFSIDTERIFWLAAFSIGGLAFLAVFLTNVQENWWAAIPSLTLFGLGGLVGLPDLWNEAGGAFFLCMIGLSFWVIFFVRRDFWWAVIPGGVLFTLGGVTMLADSDGFASGGFLFLGLALTFLIVYLLPTPSGRQRWAIWPASVLGIMGALIMSGSTGLVQYIWPVVLIVIGGMLILRATRSRERY
ncbi:MAG: hypothetical protein EHM21_00365 [Chloroflexi bacterium]|nr:MAG: hypothetical protein EHM21_00365 [Chloroflexota bacterium]